MSKKTLFQISLLLIVILISFFVFKIYFVEKKQFEKDNEAIISSDIPSDKTEKTLESSASSNIIQNITYSSKDELGNQYEIGSEYGEIDLNDPDIIFMTNVTATIKSENYPVIKIRADFAKYNSSTYETNFTGNVLLSHVEHKINSNNLDLSIKNNLVTFFDNIIYTASNTKLIADRIEIDLITKNSKVFMNDNFEKVKIFNKR